LEKPKGIFPFFAYIEWPNNNQNIPSMILRLITFPFRFTYTKFRKAIGKLDTIRIEPLYAFGNESRVLVKGRVVESYRQSKPSRKKNYLQNLLAALRRYAGNAIPEVRVELVYHGERKVVQSDEEGIIDCTFDLSEDFIKGEDSIVLRILSEEGIKPERDFVTYPVVRYPANHPRGTISDIDDTILISHATQVGRKLWLSVSKNAYTRRPFPGVSAFYKGLTLNGEHPVFYVSSSDWNLFDMIRDFLNFRNIPDGPLLLKDLHVNLRNIWKSGGGSHQHKLDKILMLLDLYPGMKFILVGDSGQHDPELYAEIIKSHPGRVEAVYIREIKQLSDQRRKLLEAKTNDPEAPAVVFVKNTEEAINHARNYKIID
jgi:phosphatidate phosphatase APP1